MNPGGLVDEAPVTAALANLRTGFDRLLAVVDADGLGVLDAASLLAFGQDFEEFRNRLSLVDHRLVATADTVGLAGHYTHSTLVSLLVSALRISPAEAARRVRASAAVGERASMVGEVLAPVRPVLAAAQRDGAVSPEQVAIVERALDAIDLPGLDPAEVARAEQVLVRHAVTFGPQDLRKISVHLTDAIQPDGTVSDEHLIADRRDLRLSPLQDGAYRCEGRLTPTLAALLKTVCTPRAKPRASKVPGPRGGEVEVADPRHHGQRMHDALEEALGRLLSFGDQPAAGGAPTSLIVTIRSEDLRSGVGHGETADGALLPTREVLRLADQAEILPAVLTSAGALLELGRSRRFASRTQTMALIARDRGCSFPGCTHPPQYCDRHHIRDWLHGGLTNLDNLTLLCRYHHTHFVGHGWTCRLNDDGVVEWIPPSWLDHDQAPLVNDRIRLHHIRQHLDPGNLIPRSNLRLPEILTPPAETPDTSTEGPPWIAPDWDDELDEFDNLELSDAALQWELSHELTPA